MAIKSLIINPGSTSTKIGVFEDETLLFEETLRHSTEEIAQYEKIVDQKDFRRKIIEDLLKEKDFDIKSLNMVVGRGGMLKPIPGGTYAVTDDLLEDLKIGVQGPHASNLGGILAREIGDSIGVPSYIVDPVVVDELEPVSRYSGVPELPRTSVFHALNQKATARKHCEKNGCRYEESNFIVVHLGGGISVSAHYQGRVIDTNNALDGDGPVAPERAGTIPAGELMELCFSGEYSKSQIKSMLTGKGGLVNILGSNSVQEIAARADEGDEAARTALDAMSYSIAKSIGEMAAVLKGQVDGIILTGGIAYNQCVNDAVEAYCRFIAPITIYPGENELESLAENALRVLRSETVPKEY